MNALVFLAVAFSLAALAGMASGWSYSCRQKEATMPPIKPVVIECEALRIGVPSDCAILLFHKRGGNGDFGKITGQKYARVLWEAMKRGLRHTRITVEFLEDE